MQNPYQFYLWKCHSLHNRQLEKSQQAIILNPFYDLSLLGLAEKQTAYRPRHFPTLSALPVATISVSGRDIHLAAVAIAREEMTEAGVPITRWDLET